MKVFDIIHYCTPKACSIGKVSLWNSRFLTSSTLSISEIFSITSPLLNVNLRTLDATLAHPFNALNKCNCLFNWWHRLEPIINIEVSAKQLSWFKPKVSLLLAVVLRAQLQQPGDEVALNGCTVICFSCGSLDVSPFSHHRKRNRSQHSSETFSGLNMAFISYISATGSLWKLQSTPVRLFLKSGPCNRCMFRDWPSKWAEKSKTTLILLSFLGWYTPWCWMYHRVAAFLWLSVFSA